MRSPLRKVKSRTQPILSEGSPPSIRLSAIAGCQLGRPLKSRTRAQTRSLRTLTTVETYTPAIAAGEAIDVQDADALDLLHRLDALAHDAFDAVEQLAAEQRVARLAGEHALGLVEQFLRLGLDCRAHPFGLGGDARLLGFLLGDKDFDRLAPLGDLAVAHRDDAFGRFRRARLGVLSLRLRGRLFKRLLIKRARLLHQGGLDLLLAGDLQFSQVPLAP